MTKRKEMTRFLIGGAIVNGTDFSIYYILFHFLPFSVSKAISFTCAGIAGFLLMKYWIFKHNEKSYAEIGRYVFINFLALGINVLTNQGTLALWPGAIFPALINATVLTGIFTYICFKWWVFRAPLKDGVYFMWWKWLPWGFLVRAVARKKGFLGPVNIVSQLKNFAQPSEVAFPMELLRLGANLHARGLINSLAIQHNLDWIWPYWVECQYNPHSESFIPRSFSLTQINLTHRNWTALGVPGGTEFSLVDPRGLLTPHYDSWSIDVWVVPEEGEPLILSRRPSVSQTLELDHNLCVVTKSRLGQMELQLKAQVIGPAQASICRIKVSVAAGIKAQLVISLRPFNPEGVSFINHVTLLEDSPGCRVNKKIFVYFDKPPAQWVFSNYHQGDVYNRLSMKEKEKEVSCQAGMASAAALYGLEAGELKEVTVSVPLTENKIKRAADAEYQETAQQAWQKSLQGVCELQIPDESFKRLYETAIYTLILHSPKEVYPGPYIYKRFWFRDAAFILYAMLSVGLKDRARRALDCFRLRQTAQGYFFSQEGEWDSNGQALWIMRQYCEMTGNLPPKEWEESIRQGGQWICEKRLPNDLPSPHAGLLPSGFSAEHLGPNDFYYWDDFWSVAGLKATAFLSTAYQDNDRAHLFESESNALLASIHQSLKQAEERLKKMVIPASPYRRLDSGAIGSLVAGYPLRIFEPKNPRILGTANFLMGNCLVHGGFFHDMTHSGINSYLTLHLAQVFLRAGDPRYFGLMQVVAKLASPTGQWPESIHPRTGGGCMGDGQHVWAAAEWIMIVRNCFVREEGNGLILCSGIPCLWLEKKQTMTFGPAPTSFGDIQISVKPQKQGVVVEWQGRWFAAEPPIDIQFPGSPNIRVTPGTHSVTCQMEMSQ